LSAKGQENGLTSGINNRTEDLRQAKERLSNTSKELENAISDLATRRNLGGSFTNEAEI
jgi:hypothetical protein